MITITVAPGETLSGIAAQYGTSYEAIASASGISNPNYIYVGERVLVPTGGSWSSWRPSSETPAHSSSSDSGGGASSGSGFSIPGMPSSLANCIAFRESTNGELSSNYFGITPGSGYSSAGDLAQQEQTAGEIYAHQGAEAWAADGCPGT